LQSIRPEGSTARERNAEVAPEVEFQGCSAVQPDATITFLSSIISFNALAATAAGSSMLRRANAETRATVADEEAESESCVVAIFLSSTN